MRKIKCWLVSVAVEASLAAMERARYREEAYLVVAISLASPRETWTADRQTAHAYRNVSLFGDSRKQVMTPHECWSPTTQGKGGAWTLAPDESGRFVSRDCLKVRVAVVSCFDS